MLRGDTGACGKRHPTPPFRDPRPAAGLPRDFDMVGFDEVDPQVRDRLDRVRQISGSQPVVAVEKSDILALRHRQSPVAGRGRPQRPLGTEQGQPRHPRIFHHLRGGVGRSVVHNDELEVRPCVAPQAFQRVRDQRCNVTHRNDDRQSGHSRAPSRNENGNVREAAASRTRQHRAGSRGGAAQPFPGLLLPREDALHTVAERLLNHPDVPDQVLQPRGLQRGGVVRPPHGAV